MTTGRINQVTIFGGLRRTESPGPDHREVAGV